MLFGKKKDFELTAGWGINFNLEDTPHVLVTGMSGAGKSSLQKLLLWQCLKHGATVFVSDFKGGIEYMSWKDLVTVLGEEETAVEVANLRREMIQRYQLFFKEGVKDIIEYNESHSEKLPRIILAVDEARELFDLEGLSNTQVSELTIEDLTSIARLGGDCGIHLFINAQHTDVIPDNVMNNLQARFIGCYPDTAEYERLGIDRMIDSEAGKFLFYKNDKWREFRAYEFDEDKMLGEL